MSSGSHRVLRTERLVLRPMCADDLEFVFRHFSDPDVHRYLVDSAPVSTIERAQAIVEFYTGAEDAPHRRWVIIHVTDDEPIGTCGIHLWSREHRRAEVGYDLAPTMWGRGLMSEAMDAVLRHGFDDLLLHRVAACIHTDNVSSLRLAERLGFAREGIARHLFLQGSTYHDHWILSLLAEERLSV